jgi:hypothetical protein
MVKTQEACNGWLQASFYLNRKNYLYDIIIK